MRWMLVCGLLSWIAGCAQPVPGLAGSELEGADEEGVESEESEAGVKGRNAKADVNCDVGDTNTKPGDKGGKPSPNDDGCLEQVKSCYSKGLDAKTCEHIQFECEQPPKPSPADGCHDVVKFCYAKGLDPEICEHLQYDCEQQPPKPYPSETCHDQVKLCYAQGLDPKKCDTLCPPPPQPDSGWSWCDEQLALCDKGVTDPETCKAIHEKCAPLVDGPK